MMFIKYPNISGSIVHILVAGKTKSELPELRKLFSMVINVCLYIFKYVELANTYTRRQQSTEIQFTVR